jgi:small-conductance mechanosensitive channel
MGSLRAASSALAALLAACVFIATPAAAQLGDLGKIFSGSGTPQPAAKADPKPATASDADTRQAREDIAKQLVAAQAQLDALEASSTGITRGAPPGTAPSEITERIALSRQLVALYQQQLDVLDRTIASRTRRADEEQDERTWTGFSTPPPYSALMVDALHDVADNAESRIASATSRRTLFERFGVDVARKRKLSETAARLAAEAADGARGTPNFARLEWQRDLAALRARVDGATQELLQMAARDAREEGAAADASLALAQRQLAVVGQDIVITPDDLARIKVELDARRRAADRELDRALRASAAAIETRSAAESRLAQARVAPPRRDEDAATRAQRLDGLDADVEVKREEAITATTRVSLLKEYRLLLDGEGAAWQARAEAMQQRDPLEARATYERLTASLATVRTWREYLDQNLKATRGLVNEQDAKLRTASGTDATRTQQLLDTYRQRENDLRQGIDQGQPLERLLNRMRVAFEARRDVSPLERAKDTAARAWLWVRQIWNFEIFSVDDSYETADGRKLAVSRSVTIGKTAGAVLIVILGYWLCSFVALRVERVVVSRGHVAPQSAALLRKWILFFLVLILIIFALISASIPLTAFAFLGGALAIAAGFGLQTLLKNLVSGIMLLVERPMRLGDYIEVDGIRGRVTSIGIRASTIRSGDGIESLFPNSTFIENKVTNWTYTSANNRQTFTVGVRYGTPLRLASDTLKGVLDRHGLVLKSPAPQVYLDAYADSAVTFALYYWVEMVLENDTRRIRSDLLHMIDEAFAKAGIQMPFSQHDVHLDVATPLKVEVVAPPAEGGKAV